MAPKQHATCHRHPQAAALQTSAGSSVCYKDNPVWNPTQKKNCEQYMISAISILVGTWKVHVVDLYIELRAVHDQRHLDPRGYMEGGRRKVHVVEIYTRNDTSCCILLHTYQLHRTHARARPRANVHAHATCTCSDDHAAMLPHITRRQHNACGWMRQSCKATKLQTPF